MHQPAISPPADPPQPHETNIPAPAGIRGAHIVKMTLNLRPPILTHPGNPQKQRGLQRREK